MIANISPDNPPMVNSTIKAIANIIGISKLSEPRHMVATQLNTFTPVGTEISMVANMKNISMLIGNFPFILFKELNKAKKDIDGFKNFSAQVVRHLTAPPEEPSVPETEPETKKIEVKEDE